MTTERTALQAGIDFIVPVWGGDYTRFFTDVCLPTFLAPGNVPALPFADRHAFQIYTTLADRAAIEASPAYRRLRELIPVTFHRVRVAEPTRHLNPLSIQSDCYRRAIRAADAADRAMFFMTPDMIIADGGLRNLAAIADRPNVRAILGTGVRLVQEAVEPILRGRHRASDSAIAIAPRALVRLLLEHIHPMARAHFYRPDEGRDVLSLSNLYWRVGGEGIAARCLHLHPYLVYPRVKNAPFSSTVDGDYIESACPDFSEVHVSADSDEFCVCELTAGSRTADPFPRSSPLARFMRWLRDSTTPRHRVLITKSIRLHTGIADAALWQRTEQEAGGVADTLLAHLRAAGYADAGADKGVGYVDAAARKVPLLFATAVRTEAEAQSFVRLTLPSLLAPANIARLVNKQFCAHRILVAAPVREIVATAPALAELREHIAVDIDVRDPAALQGDAFRAENLAAAQDRNAAVVFVEADTVLCDQALPIITTVLDLKMRAMLAPRLRIRRATAMPMLCERAIENVLSMAPDDLVRLALGHLHPLTLAQLRDGDDDQMDSSTLCWRVADEGVLVHAFDYVPVMLYPRAARAADAVDHPLLGPLGFGPNEISIIRDSKAFVQCQLSDETATAPLVPRGDAAAIADWAAKSTGVFQRLLFRNEIRLLATRAPSGRWDEVAKSATAEAACILGALGTAHPPPRA